MENKKDYEYFKSMWEDARAIRARHTPDHWNSRADDWAGLLDKETAFKKSLNERVARAADYLKSCGALEKGCRVADIGCGLGRFAAEFAKTADYVLGIDLSENMLAYGEKYAESQGLSNISFQTCNFQDIDIERMGWYKSFDLVFASITPAVSDIDSLKKAMDMSRGYCFNSSFIRFRDSLETQMATELFSKELKEETDSEGRKFYALFNLLWLTGYYPQVFYHRQNNKERVPVDDELIRYFTRSFSADYDPEDVSLKGKISDYLHSKKADDGLIQRNTERWYGWILWDVRAK